MVDRAPSGQTDFPPLSALSTGLRGRCPRCGKSSIFDGFLELRTECKSCGFDLTKADTGDGPSFFASFIGGFLVLGAGIYAQIVYEPAFWVYAVLLAVGGLACVGLLRPLKGLLTSLQYTNRAAEGRFER